MSTQEVKTQMKKSVDFLRSQLVGVGSEVNISVVSSVRINYHGSLTLLEHLSSIVKDGRRITITPFDVIIVSEIVETLTKHGFEAHKFSNRSVVVNIPLPSGEAVKKMQMYVKKLGEETKVAVRNIRRKFRTEENDKEIQKIVDDFIKEIDSLTGNL